MPASSQRQGPALAAAAIMATLASACPAFAQDRTENSFDFRLEVPAPHVNDAPAVIANPEWDTPPTPDAPSQYENRRERVVFNCGFLPDGQLSDCQTVTPHPFNPEMARIITGRRRLSARTVAAAHPEARVVFEATAAELYMPPVITSPTVMIPPTPRR
ncbi:MAG: hypothetical protein REJ23_02220 [Brevundimonas sp.]|nr:hypothetical protein [Brevundimonas sp.]